MKHDIGEYSKTHGLTETIEYSIWSNIKSRCYNPKSTYYKDYGGRGIKMCDGWLNSFELFLSDMGNRPSKDYSLDRIDNNKGYSKDNCKWSTWEEQCSNRRSNVMITYNGETKTMKQWCDVLGIPYKNTHKRIRKLHWLPERAFLEKPYTKGRYK